jgi:hypothetical protein
MQWSVPPVAAAAALVLAAPASAMRDAGARVASSSLEAAVLLAPFAAAMRLAGARVAYKYSRPV